MDVPTDAFGVLALVLLVLPGIVWISVRAAVRGRRPDDADVAGRVLQALVVSVAVDAVYLLVLGPAAVEGFTDATAADPAGAARRAAGAVLVLGVAVPAALAYLAHGQPEWTPVHARGPQWLRRPRRTTTQQSTPTAWDKAAPNLGGWIRIRTDEGRWVGGWLGDGSYVSTYPEQRDVYVSTQHQMAPDGTFGPAVPDSAGFWLALKEGDVVEWIQPQPSPAQGDPA